MTFLTNPVMVHIIVCIPFASMFFILGLCIGFWEKNQ